MGSLESPNSTCTRSLGLSFATKEKDWVSLSTVYLARTPAERFDAMVAIALSYSSGGGVFHFLKFGDFFRRPTRYRKELLYKPT